VLGTLAAFALVRYRGLFSDGPLFIAHINATAGRSREGDHRAFAAAVFSSPCERLFGIFAERGIVTIWIGHTSICTCYAAVVVIQSRLLTMDKSLEEAAIEPWAAARFQVFVLVTLPMILQSLVSAWLLTFTISLDDVRHQLVF